MGPTQLNSRHGNSNLKLCKHGVPYPATWTNCPCEVRYDTVTSYGTTQKAVKPSHWYELHNYAPANSHQWIPNKAKQFLRNWSARIPADGCQCQRNWKLLLQEFPPNTDNPSKFFLWTWQAHNAVSSRHAGNRCISFHDAYMQFWDNPGWFGSELIAVTSISPHRDCTTAIQSWKNFGLSQIHSFNRESEIASLRPMYPGVIWHANEETFQPIIDMVSIANAMKTNALLINADIEIHGNPETLQNNIVRNAITAGIRYNFKRDWWNSERENWGLDVFVLTPEMVATLPKLPLQMGRPLWDYWLPLHFQRLGYAMQFIGEPMFFHKIHEQQWKEQDWKINAQCISKHYAIDFSNYEKTAAFRRQLPYATV